MCAVVAGPRMFVSMAVGIGCAHLYAFGTHFRLLPFFLFGSSTVFGLGFVSGLIHSFGDFLFSVVFLFIVLSTILCYKLRLSGFLG